MPWRITAPLRAPTATGPPTRRPNGARRCIGRWTLRQALEGAGLSAYVYTQLSDVEEECNGILTYDRRVNKLKEDGDECGSAEM